MRDTTLAWHKDHARRTAQCQYMGILTSATGHAFAVQSQLLSCPGNHIRNRVIERSRLESGQLADFYFYALILGRLMGKFLKTLFRLLQQILVQVAKVNFHPDTIYDHVDLPQLQFQDANGGNMAFPYFKRKFTDISRDL